MENFSNTYWKIDTKVNELSSLANYFIEIEEILDKTNENIPSEIFNFTKNLEELILYYIETIKRRDIKQDDKYYRLDKIINQIKIILEIFYDSEERYKKYFEWYLDKTDEDKTDMIYNCVDKIDKIDITMKLFYFEKINYRELNRIFKKILKMR